MHCNTDNPAPAVEAPTVEEHGTSRRRALRLLGAAAAGGLATAAVGANAAADGGLKLDPNVTSTNTLTRVDYTGSAAGAAFLFQAGNALGGDIAGFPAALGGWSTVSHAPSGVYGFTNQTAGHGVVGVADGGGVGVRGDSPTGPGGVFNGASGVTASGINTGITASAIAPGGLAGSFGGANGINVNASSPTGIAVNGSGATGGLFSGTNAVIATATGFGLQARGRVGAALEGTTAALSMGTTGKPVLTRTDAHNVGEIDADSNKDLWMCVEGGTPGKWRKITGLTAAGSFHAITPTRVYDSRQPQPSPGPLSNGQNRTITVKDARNVNGGAVTIANAIPAGASAVAANITITGTTGTGFLAVNPGGNTTITASTINWFGPDQTLANGVALTLNPNRELTAICDGGGGSTHFIIDITGYYL